MRQFVSGAIGLLMVGALLVFFLGFVPIVVGVIKLLEDPAAAPMCGDRPMERGTVCIESSRTGTSSTPYREVLRQQRDSHEIGIGLVKGGGAMIGGSLVVVFAGAYVGGVLDARWAATQSSRRRPRAETFRRIPALTSSAAIVDPAAEEPSPTPADSRRGDTMAEFGRQCERRGDVAEAESWYRQGAGLGSASAMNRLGRLLHDRNAAQRLFSRLLHRTATANRAAEALHWFLEAADAGDTDAMAALGALFDEDGQHEEAERWYRRAIDAGDRSTMNNLGMLLFDRGDYAEAERWWRRAAAAGSAAARQNLQRLPHRTLAPADRRASPPTRTATPRPTPVLPDNYQTLLAMVMGDHASAEGLIEFEQRQLPDANRESWIRQAITRLRHDRQR
ncbi:tetratricopeptide repeat protein [Nocardia sp. NPDC057272]|uniref:tetratricopeptide repeat protein n=1 Tax=Nocardia sp. NPDC057272 TaxID=3346079 RepID=UPI00363DB34E